MSKKKRILTAAAEEIREFETKFSVDKPRWYVVAQCAQYEFMQAIYTEMQSISFEDREADAILTDKTFLASCWVYWVECGGTVFDTIKELTEEYLLDMEGTSDGR